MDALAGQKARFLPPPTRKGARRIAAKSDPKGYQELVKSTQADICAALGALSGQRFREDVWTREGGGGGTSSVTQDGPVFENVLR